LFDDCGSYDSGHLHEFITECTEAEGTQAEALQLRGENRVTQDVAPFNVRLAANEKFQIMRRSRVLLAVFRLCCYTASHRTTRK
jgi:hypothetical protein